MALELRRNPHGTIRHVSYSLISLVISVSLLGSHGTLTHPPSHAYVPWYPPPAPMCHHVAVHMTSSSRTDHTDDTFIPSRGELLHASPLLSAQPIFHPATRQHHLYITLYNTAQPCISCTTLYAHTAGIFCIFCFLFLFL